jgi:glutamyl-tRNA reductase
LPPSTINPLRLNGSVGQDVVKIRAAIERHGNRRTQAMETIRTILTAEVAEFKRELGIG